MATTPDIDFQGKLWIYTNYDCNLRCSYCCAESMPETPRRALGLDTVQQVVDEALDLGFNEAFLTGGEPFILDEIYDMLAYVSARMPTTVLTNAMLLRRKHLERLAAIANDNLRVQVSLDGGRAEDHDAYRGQGTWARTVKGIQLLQEHGFHVRLSSTETPANTDHIDELIAFRRSLGISNQDHFIRPLAKEGFSDEGMEVGVDSLEPELTVSKDGIFWHPLAAPSDCSMKVSGEIFPLSAAVDAIQQELDRLCKEGKSDQATFT